MPSIILNENQKYDCEHGDTVLRSALRQSVSMDYECNSGGCGVCKYTLLEGGVKDIYTGSGTLTKRDIRKNVHLACQSTPITNIKIEKPSPFDQENYIIPRVLKAKLIEKIKISENLLEYVFKTNGVFEYKPGQYFMLTIPGVGERAYSVSSTMNEGEIIKFIIKLKPGGEVTEYLFNGLKPNAEFSIDGPYGHAFYRETERNIVCIAGGAGLSPISSILRKINNEGKIKTKVSLFYGVRNSSELNNKYIDEMTCNIKNFEFIPAVSEDDESWTGHKGFIHEILDKYITDFSSNDFYFCGPPIMTSALQKMLIIDNNVPFEQLYFDRFY